MKNSVQDEEREREMRREWILSTNPCQGSARWNSDVHDYFRFCVKEGGNSVRA